MRPVLLGGHDLGVAHAFHDGLEVGAAGDRAAGALPLAPVTGTSARVRLGRDYYVRAVGNDYSVDLSVIGGFVDVVAALDRVQVTCAGQVVADHARSWASRHVITDPAHVQVAAGLRTGRAGVGVLVGVDPDDDVDLFDKTGAGLAPGRVPESPPGPGRIVAGGSRP